MRALGTDQLQQLGATPCFAATQLHGSLVAGMHVRVRVHMQRQHVPVPGNLTSAGDDR